ncbi:MAG: MFS transporter [Verrucomicrobia bacterium]|nr:MFS transporter [Verrucomicrobiota bacterium]
MQSQTLQRATRPGEAMVLWVLWLTYGSFYFCRNNLAVALPGMQAELGYTKAQLGAVLMSLKLAYAVGQFINGQLAERISPRVLLAAGMFCSALLNVCFGFGTALYFLLFVWACNGYVQALGWTPTVRVAANWFPPAKRGWAMGIIGTGYQLGGALTFVVAGWAAQSFGWRGALYVPAALLVAAGVHMLVCLRETPEAADRGRSGAAALATNPGPANRGSFRENIAITLANPALWLVAVSLGLLDACRYGFTDWGVAHLKEVQNSSVDAAAFKYAVLPLGGMAGAYVSGWATDRFFGSRRAPVICMLLVALGFLAVAYTPLIHAGPVASVAVLLLVGFCIFGAQVLLVGAFPADMARRGTAAAAVGFVNFMGYVGAAAGNMLTGYLADAHGWRIAVFFWAGCAFAGAATVACLWNATARNEDAHPAA